MSLIHESLIEAVRNRTVILFVGSGVSKNLKLPDWSQLIAHMADDVGFDPEVFLGLGDYLVLAEYYVLSRGSIGSLRSYMDVLWHRNDIKIEDSEIHRLITELKFPIIYTTNYDRWLEKAHEHFKKPHHVITGVRDLVNTREDTTQIVKFHGDFTDDTSIVLTESSYFERLSFESPLDIKLRSDVLGRTILFIGYSMSDINMRYLFFKLNKLWSATDLKRTRPKSYVFLQRPNPVQALVLENRGITPIFSSSDNPGEGLCSFLRELHKEAYGTVDDCSCIPAIDEFQEASIDPKRPEEADAPADALVHPGEGRIDRTIRKPKAKPRHPSPS